MVLEKDLKEEEDQLKHYPEYVKTIFQECPSLLEERNYNEPRKHGVVFSLNTDLKKKNIQ